MQSSLNACSRATRVHFPLSHLTKSCSSLPVFSRLRNYSDCPSKIHTTVNQNETSTTKAFPPITTTTATTTTTKNLIGLPYNELEALIKTTHPNIPSYKLKQLYHQMYQFGTHDLTHITTLSKKERIELMDHYRIDYEHLVKRVQTSSVDQTSKYLLELTSDQKMVESVLMQFGANELSSEGDDHHHSNKRVTMCLSSQIGCSLNCRFCKTGTQPIERNMTSAEIVGQVMRARHDLNNFPLNQFTHTSTKNKDKNNKDNNQGNLSSNGSSSSSVMRLSHLVFMGEGEPLFNFKNVSRAIQVLTDPNACGFSKRKVTVSTSGVVNLIPRVVNDLGVELAISLHATTNEMRDHLVPLNKTFPIEVLFDKLHSLNLKREITFEYVMLDHVNDFLDDARRLVHLLKGLPCSVNLIAFNEWEGSGFTRSSQDRINQFSEYLYRHGVSAPIRFSKGNDIDAACGQLKSSEKNKESFLRRLQEAKNHSLLEVKI